MQVSRFYNDKYLKFSSLSEISDKGVNVLRVQQTPVLDETMPNTKPEEVETNNTKIRTLMKQKIKT